jgi:hypothetical protein
MASPVSGKTGTILIGATPISELRNWKATAKSNNAAFATNATPGFKRRVSGTKDIEVSFQMLDDPAGTIAEGDHVTLVLKKTSSITWKTVPVVIDSIDVNVDIDDGKEVSYDVKASGDGSW